MLETMPETKFVDLPHGRIAYQEVGAGPPLVLIHGGGPGAFGYSNYRRNLEPLAEMGNRVVLIDLPGYGQSDFRDSEEGPFTIAGQAVVELVEHLDAGKANLVGNSLGGAASLRAAMARPELFNRLVLMGPGGSLPMFTPFPTEGLMRILNFYGGEGPTIEKLDRVIDLLVFDRSEITPDLVQERFAAATIPSRMAQLAAKTPVDPTKNDVWRDPIENIAHPTLILWGRDDRVMPVDAAFMLLKRMQNAALHVFPRCGHWVQWEHADAFNTLVGDFIAAG